MCGVVGFVGRDDEVIEKMLRAVHTRGPDQQNWIVSGDITLGHTRLNVRGSSEVCQPFTIGSASYSVNGEIYNEKPWKLTDCEQVATIPPEELVGEFAYAKCEGNSTELVRDRFGVNPMFYYWEPGFYAFASIPQAILEHPQVDDTEDDWLDCSQFVNMPIPGRTLWQHIKSVPPGCNVILSKDQPPRIGRYWDVPIGKQWREVTTEEIRLTLQKAVSLRSRDKNLCYVSNGMDGQIVAELAQSFAVTCDFEDGDDYRLAGYVLRDFPDDLMNVCAVNASRTIYNKIGVAKWKLAEAAHRLGYKVILSGQGADELFCGYQFFNSDSWEGLSDADVEEHPAFQDIYGFTPQFLTPWLKLWKASVFYPSVDPFAVVAEMFKHVRHHDRMSVQQYLWIKTHFESQILTWGGDRPEMAHSIEGRVPYLDLVDLAFSIPPPQRGNKQKLREAFGYETPKKSFMFPPRSNVYKCNLLKSPVMGNLADVARWQCLTLSALKNPQQSRGSSTVEQLA